MTGSVPIAALLKRVVSPIGFFLALSLEVATAQVEREVPGGRWYSQTGTPEVSGYAVVDDARARIWSGYRDLGGVEALGYPISRRFTQDGFIVQATQRAILQWSEQDGALRVTNLLDRLAAEGFDSVLASRWQVPPMVRFDESGLPWTDIVAGRLALLGQENSLRAYYSAVEDPLTRFGLPTSPPTDRGSHVALRTQRAFLQLWRVDTPWARAGEVTAGLAGTIAAEVGLVPAEARIPEAPSATSATPSLRAVAALLPGPEVLSAAARTIWEDVSPSATQAGVVVARRASVNGDLAKPEVATTRRLIVQVARYPNVSAALGAWSRENAAGWSNGDPAMSLTGVADIGVGDAGVIARLVAGDVGWSGHLVVFRRGEVIASVALLAPGGPGDRGRTVAIAREIDARIVREAADPSP